MVALCWLYSTFTGLVVVYGLAPFLDQSQVVTLPSGLRILYGSLHRVTWAIALGWVVFACIKGYGGLVLTNDLSSDITWPPLLIDCRCRQSISVLAWIHPIGPLDLLRLFNPLDLPGRFLRPLPQTHVLYDFQSSSHVFRIHVSRLRIGVHCIGHHRSAVPQSWKASFYRLRR